VYFNFDVRREAKGVLSSLQKYARSVPDTLSRATILPVKMGMMDGILEQWNAGKSKKRKDGGITYA
jgi:hypothetical protein